MDMLLLTNACVHIYYNYYTEEYLHYCNKYPVHHMKCVRSHIMKMLHRYTTVHIELRDLIGTSHTIDDYFDVCNRVRTLMLESKRCDNDYTCSWYMRYRQTLEINQAEYLVRGLGYVKSISDIENAVVTSEDYTSIRIKDIANVSLGPAPRRGILDKEGAEVVGGVVVARYGANPMEVINNVKEKIDELTEWIVEAMDVSALENYAKQQLTEYYNSPEGVEDFDTNWEEMQEIKGDD